MVWEEAEPWTQPGTTDRTQDHGPRTPDDEAHLLFFQGKQPLSLVQVPECADGLRVDL